MVINMTKLSWSVCDTTGARHIFPYYVYNTASVVTSQVLDEVLKHHLFSLTPTVSAVLIRYVVFYMNGFIAFC